MRRRSSWKADEAPYDLIIRTEEHDGTVWLFLAGELDLATAPLIDRTLHAAQQGGGVVVVDLAQLTFMDVSGLSVFLNASKRAEESGWRLELVNVSAPVRRVFEATQTFLARCGIREIEWIPKWSAVAVNSVAL